MPPNAIEIAGIILLPILLGLANTGGIGGGGLVIPVCITLFGFSTIQAMALSNAIISTGALVRYFGFSIFEKHPEKNATVVDYNLVSVMLPLTIGASFVAVILSNMLPDAVLTIILTLLLLYLTVDSLTKGVSLWKKETITINTQKLAY